MNKNIDCHHLTSVRKYLAIRVAQAVIEANKKPLASNPPA
jgi:hypothetical protein